MTTKSTPSPVPVVSASELLSRYPAFLLDAYGVLVNASGPLPHADRFLHALSDAGLEYLILTNDASRLPETAAAFYARSGLTVPVERILTAGSLLTPYFAAEGLQGAGCFVLGTEDSRESVRRAGGTVLEIRDDVFPEAVIVCDDAGFDLKVTLNTVVSVLAGWDGRKSFPRLVLPNPDTIYPRGEGLFGVTSGGIAALLEAALETFFPDLPPKFVRLGKPERLLFDIACDRLGHRHAVMLGDQLRTDIQGALGAGLDAVLILTGLTKVAPEESGRLTPQPTALLRDLRL